MKQRALEVLFRHKLIILLPLIVLLPLTIIFTLRPRPATWQVFSVVWVDQFKSLYQDDRLGYAPAPNQAQLLNGLLRTRTFALKVLSQTEIAPLLDDEETEQRAVHAFWRAVAAWANDNNLITIAVTMDDPDLAYDTAVGINTVFQEILRERLHTQSQVALSYYEDQLKKAETALTKSQDEYFKYVASRPDLVSRNTEQALPLAARDQTFARLSAQLATDQETYNGLRRRYDEIAGHVAAGLQGQRLAMTVVDEPRRPVNPVPTSRLGLIKLPVIGLVLGLILSSSLAVFLVLTSKAVVGAADIQNVLGVPVLGELPVLRARRYPWSRTVRDAVRLRLAAVVREVQGHGEPATSG